MNKFIAFDCSGSELLVLGSNGKKIIEERAVASGTENLLPMIDKVLKKLKMSVLDVEIVAVGVGPGSWTGSRVAVVTAYGLFEANKNIKLVSFNSFDLISYNGNEKDKVLKIVKAYANFVYAQDEKGNINAITKDELKNNYLDYKIISNEPLYQNVEIHDVDILSVVKSKIEKDEFISVEEIEPMYLRLSQAEYQRNEKLKGLK